MLVQEKKVARKEIHETLNLCNFCIRIIGLSFLYEEPKTLYSSLMSYIAFIMSSFLLVLMLAGEIAYVAGQMINNASVEEFVGSYLHIAGYDTMRLSFIDDIPKSSYESAVTNLTLIMSSTLLVLMLAGEIAYVVRQMIHTASVEEFVGSYLHIVGYGTMSFGKLLTIWYKRHTFRQLVVELAEIWPVSIRDKEGVEIKRNSLLALKHRQILYAFWNILGVWLYNLTPIAVLGYRKIRGIPSALGYVWQMAYPFDKTQPVIHGLVYVFETCSGCISVCCMLGSDLLFMSMASHISMLLRLLQDQIRHLGTIESKDLFASGSNDCYKDIVEVVKIHQRLIRYIKDLEDAFSVVNLINVLLSSVNICCVMFTIVFLDSWMEMSNKFYLGAALTQMFVICWYADDIYRASIEVADAVYESGWYRSDTSSRRAMLVVLQRMCQSYLRFYLRWEAKSLSTWGLVLSFIWFKKRTKKEMLYVLSIRSQKPLYFTALKFRAITMMTYSSILTTAYSYFTLLYTSYSRN